jgi:hypothetical protein
MSSIKFALVSKPIRKERRLCGVKSACSILLECWVSRRWRVRPSVLFRRGGAGGSTLAIPPRALARPDVGHGNGTRPYHSNRDCGGGAARCAEPSRSGDRAAIGRR